MSDQQLQERLEAHMAHCEQRFARGEEQFSRILSCLQENTEAIRSVDENTREVVQAYHDVQAAARVGNAIQKFIVWCMKWGGILAGIGYALNWILEHISKHPPGQ